MITSTSLKCCVEVQLYHGGSLSLQQGNYLLLRTHQISPSPPTCQTDAANSSPMIPIFAFLFTMFLSTWWWIIEFSSSFVAKLCALVAWKSLLKAGRPILVRLNPQFPLLSFDHSFPFPVSFVILRLPATPSIFSFVSIVLDMLLKPTLLPPQLCPVFFGVQELTCWMSFFMPSKSVQSSFISLLYTAFNTVSSLMCWCNTAVIRSLNYLL